MTSYSFSPALNSSGVKKIILKTKLLKKSKVRGCLNGSVVKRIKVSVGSKKANKTYAKKYKKIFKRSNSGRKVKVKVK